MTKTITPLSTLYLFNGDDNLKQETLLERLKKRIAAEGDLTMNSQVFTPKGITGVDYLLNALNTVPFGSPVRLVVIKEADTLSKALQEALVTYAQQPCDTTVLVLIAKKLPTSSRLYKAVVRHSAQSVIDCHSKKRSELPGLVRNMARSEGIDITSTAINALIGRVGTATVTLNAEIGKLAAIARATGQSRIGDDDVVRNVARIVEPKPWDLTNALALRDTALCLRLVGRMRGYTAVGLLIQCVAKLREILTAATLRRRGLAIASSMKKQEWQLREVIRAIDLYRVDELEALLERAPTIEMQMKSGADADQLLKLWIIDACTPTAVPSR
jgi:DNA polymerase-3 subunit delta